jgi:hypothetical protein
VFVGPSGIVDQLARSIGAEQTGGIYILPCNKRFTLTLGIAGNNYPIPSKQLLLKEDESGLCVLALAGGDEFDFFILGNPFIRSVNFRRMTIHFFFRQFCQIQNVAKLQLGFALAR